MLSDKTWMNINSVLLNLHLITSSKHDKTQHPEIHSGNLNQRSDDRIIGEQQKKKNPKLVVKGSRGSALACHGFLAWIETSQELFGVLYTCGQTSSDSNTQVNQK